TRDRLAQLPCELRWTRRGHHPQPGALDGHCPGRQGPEGAATRQADDGPFRPPVADNRVPGGTGTVPPAKEAPRYGTASWTTSGDAAFVAYAAAPTAAALSGSATFSTISCR